MSKLNLSHLFLLGMNCDVNIIGNVVVVVVVVVVIVIVIIVILNLFSPISY